MGIGVRITIGVAIAVAIAACGIEIPDVLDLDSGGSESGADVTDRDADAGLMDAPSPADVITPPSCDGACGTSLPVGFGLVLYSANRNTPCTSGQVTSDLIADPSATNNACSCGCTTTNGDCSSGPLGFWLKPKDAGVICSTQSGLPLNPSGPGCQVLNNVSGFAPFHLLDAAAPVDAGGCKLTGVASNNPVASTDVRVCVPTNCNDAICNPLNGQRLCAIAPGDAVCPVGFPEKHTVATSASVTCGCNGACTPSTVCTGVVTFYLDSTCTQLDFALSSEAGCASNPTADPGSYKYVGTPTTTCAPNGVPSSSLMLTSPQTLCCKP